MNEALCSILCGEDYWVITYERRLKFNQDGTGEVWHSEFPGHWMFSVDFKWRSVQTPRTQGEKTVNADSEHESVGIESVNRWKKQPQVLGTIDVEISLERSIPIALANMFRDKQTLRTLRSFNETKLTDAACRPKVYNIIIYKGNFVEDSMIGAEPKHQTSRYELRLLLDRALVPPDSELVTDNSMYNDFWRLTRGYVARELPESASRSPAMNDPASWSYFEKCVVQ